MKTYDTGSRRSQMNLTPPDSQLETRQLMTPSSSKLGLVDKMRLFFTRSHNQVEEELDQANAASAARKHINNLRIEQCTVIAEAMITTESAERQQQLFAEVNEMTAQSVNRLRLGCFNRLEQNVQQFESRREAVNEQVKSGKMSEECGQLLLDEARDLLLSVSSIDKQQTNALADYQCRLASLVLNEGDNPGRRRR